MTVQPGKRQRNQAEGQVARNGLECGRVFRQQQGPYEDQPPHQAGGQGIKGSRPHTLRQVLNAGSLASGGQAGLVPDCGAPASRGPASGSGRA
ncbi:hypothetical protein G6F40_017963 [Rhizopus arrhizus]|nr:hypothetical protein G6F40_017963 [Rhizopus arrhizus]